MSEVPEDKGLALVIEDDFDASVIFAKALEVLGFKPEVISTGSEAQERLKTSIPKIVILDLHLPEVVGTDLLRQIRQDERLKETRVIVASADPRMADLIHDDADLVLLKPTTFSQVRDLAERLLSRSRTKSKPRTQEGTPTPPTPSVTPPAPAALDSASEKAIAPATPAPTEPDTLPVPAEPPTPSTP